MPTHVRWRVGFFQKKCGVIDQNIRANDIFHRIQNFGMMNQLIGPVEQEVTLGLFWKIDGLAALLFPVF